jgi:pimeloyl-ACP methyl ester carboxylesterase
MILNADARRELRECDKPLLYLQASEDQFVRPETLDEIRQLKPSVKIAVVKGPHLLLQRNPRGAIEAIRAFLDELPAQ